MCVCVCIYRFSNGISFLKVPKKKKNFLSSNKLYIKKLSFYFPTRKWMVVGDAPQDRTGQDKTGQEENIKHFSKQNQNKTKQNKGIKKSKDFTDIRLGNRRLSVCLYTRSLARAHTHTHTYTYTHTHTHTKNLSKFFAFFLLRYL